VPEQLCSCVTFPCCRSWHRKGFHFGHLNKIEYKRTNCRTNCRTNFHRLVQSVCSHGLACVFVCVCVVGMSLCLRASMCSGNSLRMFSRLCVMCDLCCFRCGLWRSVSYLPWSRAISAPFRLWEVPSCWLRVQPILVAYVWKTLNITKCKDHFPSALFPWTKWSPKPDVATLLGCPMFPQMLVGHMHMHTKQIPFNNSRYFIKDYQRVHPKMVLDMWDCATRWNNILAI